MDLADYNEAKYYEIVSQFKSFSSRLDIKDITFIPISALKGDNVVETSKNLLGSEVQPTYHLENVHVGATETCRIADSQFNM